MIVLSVTIDSPSSKRVTNFVVQFAFLCTCVFLRDDTGTQKGFDLHLAFVYKAIDLI